MSALKSGDLGERSLNIQGIKEVTEENFIKVKKMKGSFKNILFVYFIPSDF